MYDNECNKGRYLTPLHSSVSNRQPYENHLPTIPTSPTSHRYLLVPTYLTCLTYLSQVSTCTYLSSDRSQVEAILLTDSSTSITESLFLDVYSWHRDESNNWCVTKLGCFLCSVGDGPETWRTWAVLMSLHSIVGPFLCEVHIAPQLVERKYFWKFINGTGPSHS